MCQCMISKMTSTSSTFPKFSSALVLLVHVGAFNLMQNDENSWKLIDSWWNHADVCVLSIYLDSSWLFSAHLHSHFDYLWNFSINPVCYSRRSAAGSARTKVTRCHMVFLFLLLLLLWFLVKYFRSKTSKNTVFCAIFVLVKEKTLVFTTFWQRQGRKSSKNIAIYSVF